MTELATTSATSFVPRTSSYRFEDLIERFPPEHRHVRFTFDCRDSGYSVQAVVILPTGTYIARTDRPRPDHRAAIDEVVDKLAALITGGTSLARVQHESIQSPF